MDLVDFDTLFQKYVVNGGLMMWILVPCSLLMLGTILQGVISLRRGRVLPRWIQRSAAAAKDAVARRQFVEKLSKSGSPLARILWLTLREPGIQAAPERKVLEERLEDAIVTVSDKMYDTVGLLSTIYTVGPLLGLVGTILGLMDTFHSYSGTANPSVKMLSEGVQTALITTFWGLSMAIPAFVAGQWMQKKIRGYERDDFPLAAQKAIDAMYGWSTGEDETETVAPAENISEETMDAAPAALKAEGEA
jgi:biopolymer transport protein ExbB